MNDVRIIRQGGGLNRQPASQDGTSGLVSSGVAVPGGVQLETVYRIASPDDYRSLGITEEYDTDNGLLLHHHLSEAFRLNPGLDLRLMVVEQAVGYDEIFDQGNGYAKNLLREADGDISQLAVAYQPATPVADFSETLAAISNAQVLATKETQRHRPVQILLEGKGFGLAPAADLRALNAPNVSVMVGQSASVGAANPTYAAIGTLLGAVSRAAVNECVAWVGQFNLLGGGLIAPYISGTPLSAISDGDLDGWNDQGYIFFRTHAGRAGVYLNDSHTCTAVTDDYAYIENNRTVNKAARGIRQELLPRLNSPITIDIETGEIAPQTIKSLELDAKRALERMQSAGEISGFSVEIDPGQDVLSTSELEIYFEVVPTGTARNITGYVRQAVAV